MAKTFCTQNVRPNKFEYKFVLGGESVTSHFSAVAEKHSRPRLELFSTEKSVLRLSNPPAEHTHVLLHLHKLKIRF